MVTGVIAYEQNQRYGATKQNRVTDGLEGECQNGMLYHKCDQGWQGYLFMLPLHNDVARFVTLDLAVRYTSTQQHNLSPCKEANIRELEDLLKW